jgi:hypothetical protein
MRGRDDVFSTERPANTTPDPSVGFAENASKRHEEQVFTVLVADVQRPGPPILRTEAADKFAHHLCRALMRLHEIFHFDSAGIQHEFLFIGAMEINVRHGRLLQDARTANMRAANSIRSEVTGLRRNMVRRPVLSGSSVLVELAAVVSRAGAQRDHGRTLPEVV